MKHFTIKSLVERSNTGHSRWSTANDRMQQETFVNLAINPKFKISRDKPILTLGSCFARNIEKKLHARGAKVPTLDIGVPTSWLKREERSPTAFMNRFNVLAMLKEIRLGLNLDPVSEDHFIRVGDDLYVDPLQAALLPLPMANLMELRKKIQSVIAAVANQGCVFLTLGLTETWFDTETNMPLNHLPDPKMVKRYPGRFAFKALGYPEVENALREMIDLLRRHAKDVKVIITVSPVPLIATFSGDDIIVSNNASKSMLRVAAEMVTRGEPDSDYYPSYEMALFSPRNLVYQSHDLRHVSNAAVRFITDRFIDAYMEPEQSPASADAVAQ